MAQSQHNRGFQSGQKPPPLQPKSYTDREGNLRPELFDEEAQAEAKLWARIKTSQVRRFFGSAMADKRRFDLSAETGNKPADSDAQVAMAMLKASTAYTAARDEDRKPLADFAEYHARLVKTLADFDHFVRHFEAVVAWHKVFEKKEEAKKNRKG